ncbi:MAG: hypothetical protein JNL72_11275 [Flavipsychrobacter sp.]|nr:hypothetical protein [Flavipsychrobacter sp.]
MKKLTVLLLAAATLAACTEKREQLLTGNWHAVNQKIPTLDSMLKIRDQFLDTVGQNTTPEQELELYGSSNIDSLIREENVAMDLLMKQQKEYLEATRLEFRNDGVVVFNLMGRVDSASWSLVEGNELLFDEIKLKGAGDKTTLQVEALTADSMALSFSLDDFTSTISFRKDK